MLKIDPEQLETADLKDVLQYLIEKHAPLQVKASKLQAYYEGQHDILTRTMADTTKPNNKLVNNLAAYITDTISGYFMGKPIAYSTKEDAYFETVNDILDYNDEQDHNAELAKSQSIKGCGYELLYMDEDAKVRFAELPRENVIYVETDDVATEPVIAVRIYEIDQILGGKKLFYEVYTDEEIVTYETVIDEEQKKSLVEIDRLQHYFGGVPVVAYPNNKELMGDFEGVISLIDAYNRTQSDTANDFEYFTDAYLMLTGVEFDAKDIKLMKENRTISLPDKECDAGWLIKTINDVAIENYKDRLRKDIHALSKTPNLTDENFSGDLSGVAISYKIWGLEQIASMKERKFKRALQRRLELITNILNKEGNNWDWRDIDITFSRNMPQNLVEIVDAVSKLKGIVSDLTLLAQLPFVTDPQEELDRITEQNEAAIDLDAVDTEETTETEVATLPDEEVGTEADA